MSSSSGKGNFVEINDHAVIALRTSLANGTVQIEAWREIALQNRMEAAEAVRSVFPEGTSDAPVQVQCAVRPAQRFFKIASADESKQHGTAAAARAFVNASLPAGFDAAEIACLSTRDGRLLGGGATGRWFATAAPKESLDAALAMLTEWNLHANRVESATPALIGVAQAALGQKPADEPLVIWDAGANHSDLLLVSAAGLEGTRRLEYGYEQVFDALMSEIQLKFKGAAVRLFFNDRYDFTEAGPKIAGRVAAALQEGLAALALQAGGRMPVTFCCASLPSKQAWFNQHLASALHLAPWAPDVAAWARSAGVSFADTSLPDTIMPNALSALSLAVAGNRPPEADAWHGAWIGGATEFVAKAAAPAPSPVTAAKAPAAPARAVETPAARPAVVPTPAPVAKSEPAKVAAKAAGAATAEAARTPVKRPAQSPAFPAPAKKPGGEDESKAKTETSTSTPAKPTTPPAAPAAPAGGGNAGAPAAGGPQKSGSKLGLIIGVAALLVLGGGGYFAYSTIQAQKAAAEKERLEAEQRAAELIEANRQAELKAEAEAEARRIAEEQAAAQLKAAQAARERADQEAKQRAAETQRLLNARGSLIVKTEPADAMVTVGNLAPRPSPAAFHDLRLGKYTVEVTKPGYDPVRFEVDVKENVVIDQGEIPLVRQTGGLQISTTPAGASYSVQPVSNGSFSLELTNQYRGQTPATLNNLPTGEYTVTFERPGWTAKTQTVKIEKGATANIAQEFTGGTVQITSIPEGAEVFANNVSIGRTPLTLQDISPGKVDYRLELADHIPANTSGTVAPEATLDLTTFLVPIEKLARVSELDSQPRPIKTVQPNLPKEASTYKGQKVLISLVIDENGEPRDWRIIQSPDETLAETCIEAIAQWRFEPATVKGRPVKVRVTVPLVLN